jgi:hypothetical protein
MVIMGCILIGASLVYFEPWYDLFTFVQFGKILHIYAEG